MGRNNSTDLAKRQAMVDARRAKVASYKVRGFSIRETVEALAKDRLVNPETNKPWSIQAVHSDLAVLTEQWKVSAARDITEAKAAELAKLDELEREAWAAWYRSIGRVQTRTTKTGRVTKDGDLVGQPEVTLKTEVIVGDPRFMAVILDCQQRRAKMLGLDAPEQLEVAEGFGELLRKARERAQA